MSIKLDHVKQLAIKVKNGDRDAEKELLGLFNPLIYKISKQIYTRYGQIFPLNEIATQSKCALIYLTVSIYQPNGKAHYPYFIKKALHAHLVQLYRPIYTLVIKSVPLDQIKYIKHEDEPCIDERMEICKQLFDYIEANFNKREKALVYGCMCGTIPHNIVAEYYHISAVRIGRIYKKTIGKLKSYLSKSGVNTIGDI